MDPASARKLELQNTRAAGHQEQLEFNDAQQKFNDVLIRGINEFGKNEGFDLILDMGAVAWAGQTIDVTTAIIDIFDSMFPAAADGSGGARRCSRSASAIGARPATSRRSRAATGRTEVEGA